MFDAPLRADVTLMFDESGTLILTFATTWAKADFYNFKVGAFALVKLIKSVERGMCSKPDQTCIEITFKTGAKDGLDVESARQILRQFAETYANTLAIAPRQAQTTQASLF